MRPELMVIFGIFLVFACLEAYHTGLFGKRGQVAGDAWVEGISAGVLGLVTQPGILLLVNVGLLALIPQHQNALAQWPWWSHVLLLLVFDDMMQYWWHRLSHSVPWLYKMHRPHHNAAYMSVRLVYRNSIVYYAMMPGIWFSAVLIYLGLGWTYAFYIVVKMLVITGAHCDWHWDAKLYRIKALSPLMWVVERLISTPSTHSAHHGKHMADGITHYKGNFGNLLFFWDVLFGTAKITRQRPAEYGVENLPPTDTVEQLLWPLVKRRESYEPVQPVASQVDYSKRV